MGSYVVRGENMNKEQMAGKDLESIVSDRIKEYKKERLAHVTRCGVQAIRTGDNWQVIRSLPDFEGVHANGNQFIFDCKVCSQSSFGLSEYRAETKGSKVRQLRHMLERSQFGVTCFFLMHWNQRQLKTFSEAAETFLFPIDASHEFWDEFAQGEIRKITREDCRAIGVEVEWNAFGQGRVERPDFLKAINEHLIKTLTNC